MIEKIEYDHMVVLGAQWSWTDKHSSYWLLKPIPAWFAATLRRPIPDWQWR